MPRFDGAERALRRGADFLGRQQIDTSFEGFADAYRSDPKGGWCLAGRWHGWPVTDCTAEAVLGLIAGDREAAGAAVLGDAAANVRVAVEGGGDHQHTTGFPFGGTAGPLAGEGALAAEGTAQDQFHVRQLSPVLAIA